MIFSLKVIEFLFAIVGYQIDFSTLLLKVYNSI